MTEIKPAAHIAEKVMYAAIVAAGAFLWHVNGRLTKLESQADIVQRVAALETAIQPMLVEYRVQAELRKLGVDPYKDKLEEAAPPTSEPTRYEDVRKEAESWANEAIKQAPNAAH